MENIQKERNIHKSWNCIGTRKAFRMVDRTQYWDCGYVGFEPHLYSPLFVKPGESSLASRSHVCSILSNTFVSLDFPFQGRLAASSLSG